MVDYFQVILSVVKHPYFILSSIVWTTYLYALRCGFVSDDHQGLVDYDGKLQTRGRDSFLASVKEANKLTAEEEKTLVSLDKRNILLKLLDSEYGMISRWIRFHLVGGNQPSKIVLGNGQKLPLGKTPPRHHALSIVVFNVCVILGYIFFSKLFGEKVSFIAMSLFTLSPIGTQCIAWISALGYPLSLFWLLIILNYTHSTPFGVVSFLVFCVMDIMAINALFVALALPFVLLFLGLKEYAIVSLCISIFMGLRIVKHTITIRADEFKKQDMGALTKLHVRRFVTAIKTVLYYLELLVWPNKLGLYHEWGNHPTSDLELDDRRFYLGLVATVGLIVIFFLTPIMLVKFSILWFFAFIFIFLNWITIQQFVTERYLWIPSIGFYLVVAYVLQDYAHFLYLIGGIYICRTWLHLPTYDDELRFYLSNTWNYQNSEVALSNLGCTWIKLGAVGSALDTWHASHKANPDYDVPLANIYFHHRSNAMFDVEHGNYELAIDKFRIAHKYIELCCKCSVMHFKDDWNKELRAISSWLANPLTLVVAEKKRLTELRRTLMERRAKPGEKDIPGIDISLGHISQRLVHIEDILSKAPKDRIPEEATVDATQIFLPGQTQPLSK